MELCLFSQHVLDSFEEDITPTSSFNNFLANCDYSSLFILKQFIIDILLFAFFFFFLIFFKNCIIIFLI